MDELLEIFKTAPPNKLWGISAFPARVQVVGSIFLSLGSSDPDPEKQCNDSSFVPFISKIYMYVHVNDEKQW